MKLLLLLLISSNSYAHYDDYRINDLMNRLSMLENSPELEESEKHRCIKGQLYNRHSKYIFIKVPKKECITVKVNEVVK